MFPPCLWKPSRDKVKTGLILQTIACPSRSVDGWDTKLALWAELREEREPRVITEFSWIRESVQGEKQGGEGCGRPANIPQAFCLLTLSTLNNQTECLHGGAKSPVLYRPWRSCSFCDQFIKSQALSLEISQIKVRIIRTVRKLV